MIGSRELFALADDLRRARKDVDTTFEVELSIIDRAESLPDVTEVAEVKR